MTFIDWLSSWWSIVTYEFSVFGISFSFFDFAIASVTLALLGKFLFGIFDITTL